jgi:lauroyl/myristoyl acyltransferase
MKPVLWDDIRLAVSMTKRGEIPDPERIEAARRGLAAFREMPVLLQRAREFLELRRYPLEGEEADLMVRIAYGNLLAALGNRQPRVALQRFARQSRDAVHRSSFELRNPFLWGGFQLQGLDHLRTAAAAGRGVFVVSFHVGPYRFIPLELAQLGFEVEVVVDQRGMDRESLMHKVAVALRRHAGAQRDSQWGYWRADVIDRLHVINAETADVALQIVRALRQGRVVMVYLDGNTGAGQRKAEHVREIPFFDTQIQVRAGVGEIAAAVKAPIVLALTRRSWLRRHRCRFGAPIGIVPGEGRAAFADRLLRELIGGLEQRLRAHPGDWEEWHHLHRMQDPPPAESPAAEAVEDTREPRRLWVDSYRAFAFSAAQSHYVFEPERRRFVSVDDVTARIVRALYRPRRIATLAAAFTAAHGPDAVAQAMAQVRSRGWAEPAF